MPSIPRVTVPPPKSTAYIIPQLDGETITIPGSKSAVRILTSSLQTNGAFSVFSSGSVLADAPGFHHHNEAHDIFLVTKGFLKLWNGDECRILGPGDFASVPPGVIHNPQWMGPHTETWGLVSPGNWVDFFRYISDSCNSILLPEFDERNLKEILIPKVMAAKGKYDVHFHPKHVGCEVSEWSEKDEKIPDGTTPYYLRSNTGPRWMLSGVMSRPFCTTKNSSGIFAISSIESSSVYGKTVFERPLTFPDVDHCFTMFEGALEVTIGDGAQCRITEGETLFIPRGTAFSLKFDSKFVRLWSFATGDGIEALIHEAGKPFKGYVIPDKVEEWEDARFEEACKKLNITT